MYASQVLWLNEGEEIYSIVDFYVMNELIGAPDITINLVMTHSGVHWEIIFLDDDPINFTQNWKEALGI